MTGSARSIAAMVQTLVRRSGADRPAIETVVLSGGCFQNKRLLEAVTHLVEAQGLTCLSHGRVPSNDGGLALVRPRSPPRASSHPVDQESNMCLGIPGQVVSITDAERQLAMVDVGGVLREVNLACIVSPEHPLAAASATGSSSMSASRLSRIDEAEAALTLETLAALGELQAETAAIRASGQ